MYSVTVRKHEDTRFFLFLYLEDRKQRDGESIEVGGWSAVLKVELAAE